MGLNGLGQAGPGDQDQLGDPQFIKFFVGGILYSAKGNYTFSYRLLANLECLSILEIDVETYFAQYGKVVDVAIMRDKHTGRSRGFAFVTFETHNLDALHSLKQTLLCPKVPHVI